MKIKHCYNLALVLTSVLILQGCSFLAGAAVGGAAGYMMTDKGYDVRSPVTHEYYAHR